MSDWQPDFAAIDREPPQWAAKRPVRILLMGDFSAAAASGRLETGSELAARKTIPVEYDSIEDAFARLGVTLNLPLGEDGAGVEVAIPSLDAFHPDELYANLELFNALSGLRQRLNNTGTFAKAAKEVQSWAGKGKGRVSRTARKGRARGAALAADARLSDFARLVGHTSAQGTAPVDSLVQRIVAPFVVAAADPKKDELVATVDKALSDAMRAVLHQGDFQQFEALWRGVDFLVRRLETGPDLQVHLLDVTAEEFAADLSSVSDLAESGLYSLLVDKPSQHKDGGYSYVLGLFQFEATPPHAELLGRMARIADHAGAPFLTALDSAPIEDRKRPPHELVQQAFKALKKLDAAASLALLAPRFLLRHPYGKRSDPISSFAFEEFTAEAGLRGMLWGHPALLAAVALASPAGLNIGELPFHHMQDADGDTIALPCTERLISAGVAAFIGQTYGLTSVQAHKGEPLVRLSGLTGLNGKALAATAKAAKAAVGRSSVGVHVGAGTGVGGKGVTVTSKPVKIEAEEESSSDVDDLLASLGGDSSDSSSSDSSSDSGGSDDLDALLASLGGDDSSSSSDSSDDSSSGESSSDGEGSSDDMDPELAALLKSLEG